MDSTQPQPLVLKPEIAPQSVHIGLIADIPNAMTEGPFESKLRHAIRANTQDSAINLVASPLLNHLHTASAEQELRSQMNMGQQVVVAMLGVPSTFSYEQDIHQLLTAWSGSQKPVLLIASSEPEATRRAVDGWQGWELLARRMQQPVEELKKAVIVNDEYLVSQSGEKALAQIRNSITVAQSLKPALNPQPRTPAISVQRPRIEGMELDRTPQPI